MSDDIRLQSDWYQNPKIKKLGIMNGSQAIVSLLTLWAWTGKNRPKGVLHDMDEFDIALAANWPNDAMVFIEVLLKLRLLDKLSEWYAIHDWSGNQPWAMHTEARKDAARKAAEARWEKRREQAKVSTSCDSHENQCDLHDSGCGLHKSALRNAPFFDAPSPSPSPSPNHSTTQEPPLPPRDRGGCARGTRWADDRTVPQEWKDWAKSNYPLVDIELQAKQFENHWCAKAGKEAIKINWEKTWQNWIIRSPQFRNQPLINIGQSTNQGAYNGTKRETTASRIAKWAVPGKAPNQRPTTEAFEDGFSGRTFEHVGYCAE